MTTSRSGNNTAGGDFSFRLFFLPGDAIDESAGNGTRTVNTNDSQVVRDFQNGFVVAGLGAVTYNSRADLDGSGFINSNDSQLVRDRQAGIIFRQARANGAQNRGNQFDVNNDQQTTPMDALLIINAINTRSVDMSTDNEALVYLDVSGDGIVSPFDALLIINVLNGNGVTNPDGDGKGPAAPPQVSHVVDMALSELVGEVEGPVTSEYQPEGEDFEAWMAWDVETSLRKKMAIRN